jgi:hypothetical protein
MYLILFLSFSAGLNKPFHCGNTFNLEQGTVANSTACNTCIIRMTTPAFLGSTDQKFFFIMYFSLPDSIPPRPLGEARVRKHCVTLLYDRITIYEIYIIDYVIGYLVHVI